MTPKLFSELGLSAEVLKAIDKLGFEQAAPIQASAIPILMAGGDVVGQSQTGSGKTAAFAIPAIEKVDPRQRGVQVLILCPTRELAVQVSEEVHKLALFKRGLHALPIYGGQSYDRQLAGLKQGANIVIGTPGRVMDHMRRGTLKLDGLKMVILDEVDVMLNMGFRDDIEVILQAAPTERQTVFFSATIPRPIQQLIEKYSRNPQQVRIEQKALTVPTVEQVYYEVDRHYKIELLTRLIDIHDLKLGIIFCNTKRMVDDLVDHLERPGLFRRPSARRHDPADARSRDEQVSQVRSRISRGHRRCRARHRCGRRPGRVQLRPAVRRRGLSPSHRPHGPRGPQRPGDLIRRRPRNVSDPQHRAFHEGQDTARQTADGGSGGRSARRGVSRQTARHAEERRLQEAGSSHRTPA